MFDLRVGKWTCWLINSKLAKSIRRPAEEQWLIGFSQFTPGKLKSPSIIMLGRGDGSEKIKDSILQIMSSNSD